MDLDFRPPQLKLFWVLATVLYALCLVCGVIASAQVVAYPAPVSTGNLLDFDERYLTAMVWAATTGWASAAAFSLGVFFTIVAWFVGAATNIAEKHARALMRRGSFTPVQHQIPFN